MDGRFIAPEVTNYANYFDLDATEARGASAAALGMINRVHQSETDMAIPITERLREATRTLHSEVERAGVMRLLLLGQLECAGYCRLLRNLHAVYVALEAGLMQNASNPALAALRCEPLFRGDALSADLNFLDGPNWPDAIRLTEAATQYSNHLTALAGSAPLLLGAHAYVRYLGDLSGGQVLKQVVAKRLRLQSDHGVQFYDFGSAADVANLAQTFRAALNLMADDEASAQALADEACAAFARHRTLFEALAET